MGGDHGECNSVVNLLRYINCHPLIPILETESLSPDKKTEPCMTGSYILSHKLNSAQQHQSSEREESSWPQGYGMGRSTESQVKMTPVGIQSTPPPRHPIIRRHGLDIVAGKTPHVSKILEP